MAHTQVGDAFKGVWPVTKGQLPETLAPLFMPAASVPAPFKPFYTQYDTYLLRWQDIAK